MKYYLDEDLSQQVAERLRKAGVSTTYVHEEKTEGWTYEQQLEKAAQDGRCLVTRNRNDFIELTVQFYRDEKRHAGVLIVPYSYPGDQISQLAKALIAYVKKHPDGMLAYGIDFLPPPPK